MPRWFRVVGPAGAAAIVGFSIPVQTAADGSPVTMGGALGFLAWLLFLVLFGLRLINTPSPVSVHARRVVKVRNRH